MRVKRKFRESQERDKQGTKYPTSVRIITLKDSLLSYDWQSNDFASRFSYT